MKTSSAVRVTTSLDLKTAAQVVNAAFKKEKADIERVDVSANPLDSLDGQPDLAVVGSREGMTGRWAVQAYFTSEGSGTEIIFVALGHTRFSRSMSKVMMGNDAPSLYSLPKSTDKALVLVEALRAADPRIRVES